MPYRPPELFHVNSKCEIDERTDVWVSGGLSFAMDQGPDSGANNFGLENGLENGFRLGLRLKPFLKPFSKPIFFAPESGP